MEIFRDNEKGYFDWIRRSPNGFVLNARRQPSPNYLVLHIATCRHISGHASNQASNAFTGRDYIKVCSKDIEEIKAWASLLGGNRFTGVCKDCQPQVTTSFGNEFQGQFEENVTGNHQPRAVLTQTLTYQRDQRVVQATLGRAGGMCERCQQQAPFNRRIDGEPYLEVHHTVPLSQGGVDTLETQKRSVPTAIERRIMANKANSADPKSYAPPSSALRFQVG